MQRSYIQKGKKNVQDTHIYTLQLYKILVYVFPFGHIQNQPFTSGRLSG